jgi:hypothetical protein
MHERSFQQFYNEKLEMTLATTQPFQTIRASFITEMSQFVINLFVIKFSCLLINLLSLRLSITVKTEISMLTH